MSRSSSRHQTPRSCRCHSSRSGYDVELINANSNHLLVGVQYKPCVSECAVRKQISEVKEELTKLKQISDQKDHLIVELTDESKSSRTCHCAKACLIHNLEKSNHHLKKELSFVQDKLESTSSELKDAKIRQRIQEEYITLLKNEIADLKTKRHSDHLIIVKPTELPRDDSELLALRQENSSFRLKVEELESKINQVTQERTEWEENIKTLKASICLILSQATGTEVDDVEEGVRLLVEKLNLIVAEKTSISEERCSIEEQLNVLKLENQNNHETIERLVKDINRLENDLNEANTSKATLEQLIQSYLDQIAQLEASNQQLQADLQTSSDALSSRETEIESIRAELAVLISFKERLVLLISDEPECDIEEKIRQLKDLTSSLSLRLSSLEESLKEQTNQREEIEKKLKDLEAEKATLLDVQADQKLKIEFMCQKLYKLDQMSSKRCELEKDLCYKSAMVKRLKYKMEKLFELSKKLRRDNQNLKELLELNCVAYNSKSDACCCCSKSACLELDCFDYHDCGDLESFLSSIKCNDI